MTLIQPTHVLLHPELFCNYYSSCYIYYFSLDFIGACYQIFLFGCSASNQMRILLGGLIAVNYLRVRLRCVIVGDFARGLQLRHYHLWYYCYYCVAVSNNKEK